MGLRDLQRVRANRDPGLDTSQETSETAAAPEQPLAMDDDAPKGG